MVGKLLRETQWKWLLAWLGLGLVAGASMARGEEAAPPDKPKVSEEIAFARNLSRAFRNVASKADASVVHISQFGRVLVRQNIFDSGHAELRPTGLGSGFIVSGDGMVVTNNHVVQNAEKLKVRLADGREYDAKILGRDALTDVAVLKIDATGLTPLAFADSDEMEVGDWVVAIGSPFGFSNTVTAGIVSAKGRSLTPPGQGRYEDYIQTDAAINPGNSGGPLLNLEGQVVGVNTAIASSSGGSEGLGFAIPSNLARGVMENIVKNGRVVRGWLGVELQDVALPGDSNGSAVGARVVGIEPDSPADQAGLKVGDVIRQFQGRHMDELRLRGSIAVLPPGTKVAMDIVREGKRVEVSTSLGDRDEYVSRAAAKVGQVFVPRLGITVKTLTRAEARAQGYRSLGGVMVSGVDKNSKGDAIGLQEGDILHQLDRRDIEDADQFARAMADADLSKGAVLGVVRGRMSAQVVVGN